MAKVWFSVIVLTFIQQSLGNICRDVDKITNCNECMRCGSDWCSEPGMGRCTSSGNDNWCSTHREILPVVPSKTSPGDIVTPIYSETTAFVGTPNKLDLTYSSAVERKVTVTVANTTQSSNIEASVLKNQCDGSKCIVTIETNIKSNFCFQNGTVHEYVYVKVNVESISEEALVRYHVPCACECSLTIQRNSTICHGRGDHSCGACTCHAGWTGQHCDQSVCGEKRGDVQCNNPTRSDVECSGNGFCGPCDTCVCYTDREGSQYFDQDNYCTDLCMITSECDLCLRNNKYGECQECDYAFTMQPYNESIARQTDHYNRKVWTRCNETMADGCYIEYIAMRSDTGIYAMIVKSCNDIEQAAIGAAPAIKLPLILGLVAMVATVAAVGGYMIWKKMSGDPLPFAEPHYHNIDAKDASQQNPLYIPPVSSYKNPTYGKA